MPALDYLDINGPEEQAKKVRDKIGLEPRQGVEGTGLLGAFASSYIASALDAAEEELKDLGRGKAWVAYQQDGVRASAIPIDIPLVKLPTGWLKSNIKMTQHRYAVPRRTPSTAGTWTSGLRGSGGRSA